MSAQKDKSSTVKNVIAIVAFALLLLVGIWSAVQVIMFVPRLFSDTGVATQRDAGNEVELGDRDIVARLSKETVQSGEPVTIEWAHSGTSDGVLSFSYACKEGFYFQIDGRTVACNAPYNILATDSSLEVVPLSAKASVEAPLAITYTNPQGESVRDTQTLTVNNFSIAKDTIDEANEDTVAAPGPIEPVQPSTATTVTNEPVATVTPRPVVRTVRIPRTSNPYGTSDLATEMVAIGDINRFGEFEAKGVVRLYARGAAKFKVTNLGDKQSGSWYFLANLPTQGGYPFTSQIQPSLMPGASAEIFMTFDQLVPGIYPFTVHVDPFNQIQELSELNNTTGLNITVLNY
ncbi:hypothetical protein CL652_02145 [bacterium]|nr:hypothetical protein [bacterium]